MEGPPVIRISNIHPAVDAVMFAPATLSAATTGTARNAGTSVSKITNRTGQPSFRRHERFDQLGNPQGEVLPSDVDLQHHTGKDQTGNGLMGGWNKRTAGSAAGGCNPTTT